MNKRIGVVIIVSLLILSLIGSVYAVGLFDGLFRKKVSNPVLLNIECSKNSDCRLGQVCYRNSCRNIEPSEPQLKSVPVPLPGVVNSKGIKPVLTPKCSVSPGVSTIGTSSFNSLFDSGISSNVPITNALTNSIRGGYTLQKIDLDFLKDSSISISAHDFSEDYDYHEEIRLADTDTNKISVETGLTYGANRDENWKDNVFLVMPQNSFDYYLFFDEPLHFGNYISQSTTLEPTQIEFLGNTLSIQNTITSSTARVDTHDPDTLTLTVGGKKVILNVGESLSVVLSGETYTITLMGTTSTGTERADVKVVGPDGTEREVIDQDTSLSFNSVGSMPLQVRVEDVFDEDGIVNDRATLIVGDIVRRTYNNNDPFI